MGEGPETTDHLTLSEMALITYSTAHLMPKDKTRFYYALKGRDGRSGMLKRTGAVFLAKSVLLVPRQHEEDVRGFLGFWKCGHTVRRALVSPAEVISHAG
ncbi:hypothetical protein JXB02_04045 [Candidatus Woesearchaeota archaeon]|nr:hypothetical protein [Candidatus Woesearchaeota archaeon]